MGEQCDGDQAAALRVDLCQSYVDFARYAKPKQQEEEIKEELVELAFKFLALAPDSVKFSMQGFSDMLLRSIKDKDDTFSFGKAAIAFSHLEKIALNLFRYPWRSEFRTIKLYTGTFVCHVSAHLSATHRILEQLGYRKLAYSRDVFYLHGRTDPDVTATVAFDCFLAYAECCIQKEIYSRTRHQGYSMTQVVDFRMQVSGDRTASVASLLQQPPVRLRKVGSLIANGSHSSSSESLTKPIDQHIVADTKPPTNDKKTHQSADGKKFVEPKRTKPVKGSSFHSLRKYINGAKNSVLPRHLKKDIETSQLPCSQTLPPPLPGKSSVMRPRACQMLLLVHPQASVRAQAIGAAHHGNTQKAVTAISLQLSKASTISRASNVVEEMRRSGSPKFARSISAKSQQSKPEIFVDGPGVDRCAGKWVSVEAGLTVTRQPNVYSNSYSNSNDDDDAHNASGMPLRQFIDHEEKPALHHMPHTYDLSGIHHSLPRSYRLESRPSYTEERLRNGSRELSAPKKSQPMQGEAMPWQGIVPVPYTFASVVNGSNDAITTDRAAYRQERPESHLRHSNGELISSNGTLNTTSLLDVHCSPYLRHHNNVHRAGTNNVPPLRDGRFATEGEVMLATQVWDGDRCDKQDLTRRSFYDNLLDLDDFLNIVNKNCSIDGVDHFFPVERGWTCPQCRCTNPAELPSCKRCASRWVDFPSLHNWIPCPGCGKNNPKEALTCTWCESFLRGRSTYI
ncbi:PREDICTED: uncharacterized protein LOC106818658 [Priapulus caudatus]|uniref:Uncharacterized protein LOC106818658 n=1 Tax=Priapulus caudatus TaxID=37621 RepID=A0ABM1F309_PRICU|nr:PREDICTED: uncharacterized protein LOC106818658 [Priapulus caudatus]XP_014678831.1 PREDICTED: uncharacterized protein LOC106818658 [Priapulus caudatus]